MYDDKKAQNDFLNRSTDTAKDYLNKEIMAVIRK